jgi:hypothetical protein
VLADFCRRKGLKTASDIFSSREQDYILQALLDIPWQRIDIRNPIPYYRRGLDLPEYDSRFIKHLSPNTALYSEFWISDSRSDPDSPFRDDSFFRDVPFYKITEDTYYANTGKSFSLGEVNKLLKKGKSIAIELDGLIKFPELKVDYEFEKGVFVEPINKDLVCVCGLVVDHPGQMVAGIGVVEGWYYRIDGDNWTKIEHPDQCPCNNRLRHELQFSLLRVLNESLGKKEIVAIDSLNYTHKDMWQLDSPANRTPGKRGASKRSASRGRRTEKRPPPEDRF